MYGDRRQCQQTKQGYIDYKFDVRSPRCTQGLFFCFGIIAKQWFLMMMKGCFGKRMA